MRSIGFSAFFDCTSLGSITGCSGVQEIDSRAFRRNAITSFPWGKGLRRVSGIAFEECPNYTPTFPSYLTLLDNGDYALLDDEVVVSATCDYDLAAQVLALVKSERSAEGPAALAMDADLQATAMKRAAEISLYFDHGRSDGTDCFDACAKMSGENIAAGSSTAACVMNQWMNSAGHKANILSEGFSSIGVGCARVGGLTYWVQCFGRGTAEGAAGSGTKKGTYKIKVRVTAAGSAGYKKGHKDVTIKVVVR